MSRTNEGVQAISQELEFDKTARADFAKVKEILRGYSTLFPESSYVPETHYILALAYEQLNQDEESISQLLSLLREADFNPSADVADEQFENRS